GVRVAAPTEPPDVLAGGMRAGPREPHRRNHRPDEAGARRGDGDERGTVAPEAEDGICGGGRAGPREHGGSRDDGGERTREHASESFGRRNGTLEASARADLASKSPLNRSADDRDAP